MRTSLRSVAVLALCASGLLAIPAVAAAATHKQPTRHAKHAKHAQPSHAKPSAAPQGNGGAVYSSPTTSTQAAAPAVTGGSSATGGATSTGGANAGGASAPTASSGVTKASGAHTVNGAAAGSPTVANTVTSGPTGVSGATGPSGASGSTGTTGVGGASAPSGPTGPTGPTGATGPSGPTTPGLLAKILADGLAEAPAGAPLAVKQAIAAANQLIGQPYVYGGGHKSFISDGYDCSGAVSYALHGANLLSSPLDSGALEQWGSAGRGAWITVYTNAGHAYVDIAGIRFDTSRAGDPGGLTGPRWRPLLASNAGFIARHPAGL
jgi:cell wall-associated NlpC family hydrolase